MRIVGTVIFALTLISGCADTHDDGVLDPQDSSKNTEFMLSFDDGPLPDVTERVLDMLAALHAVDGTPVKAGFFLLADTPEDYWQRRSIYAPYELWTGKGSIAKHPEIAIKIKQAGHIIGNHTAHHPWYRWPWLDTAERVLAEFNHWETVANHVFGTSDKRLFRPPYNILTNNVRNVANQLSYQIILGESAGDAVPNVSVAAMKKKTESILNAWNKPSPCVLIFHDNRPATYGHLTEIVHNLQQQGFRLVHFEPERL